MNRDDVAMMARVKNEERWISRCLERTWSVAKTAVIWDDGSVDRTETLCAVSAMPDMAKLAEDAGNLWVPLDCVEPMPFGWIARGNGPEGVRELHFLRTPFAKFVRPKQRINEIRDKNMLWYYLKASVAFKHVLCLDGDEMLSQEAIRDFPSAIQMLETRFDILNIPVIYYWDSEDRIRVDGIYSNGGDGLPQLRFPRLFTIARVSDDRLFNMCFQWFGTKGGFHCGSIPRQEFRTDNGTPEGSDPSTGLFRAPIVHFGYIDDPLRRRKFEFYNTIDPNNEFEGGYRHIIGEPNCHAPGPVQLRDWSDL